MTGKIRLDPGTAGDVLACAVKTGGDFAEIFVEDRLSHAMTLRSRLLENVATVRDLGAGIRVFSGTRCIYVYTNDTSREGLMQCAASAAAAVREGKGSIIMPFHPTSAVVGDEVRIPPDTVKGTLKAEKLRAADSAARSSSDEIAQVICSYADVQQDVLIANTEGVFVTDRRTRTRLSCQAVAGNGKENQIGTAAPGAGVGFEAFDGLIDPEKAARMAAATAVTMLHAPLCPAGYVPVVIGNGFGGVLFHEACGHSLEATSVAPGHSEFTGRLGQQIASPIVTAVDDGTIPGAWGSIHVDDEGMAATNLTLIKDGILVNYMVDKLGGRRMGMEPTGSGRRQGYSYAPTSRMRNTFIAPGQDDEQEMIATMGEGLYAKKMGGGSVNPSTGEFNFAVTEGYWVKDGRIVHPVRGASLVGRGSEVLMKIDRVGRDLEHAQGMCGSSSGSIPTCVGQPTIRISGLTVGGGK